MFWDYSLSLFSHNTSMKTTTLFIPIVLITLGACKNTSNDFPVNTTFCEETFIDSSDKNLVTYTRFFDCKNMFQLRLRKIDTSYGFTYAYAHFNYKDDTIYVNGPKFFDEESGKITEETKKIKNRFFWYQHDSELERGRVVLYRDPKDLFDSIFHKRPHLSLYAEGSLQNVKYVVKNKRLVACESEELAE